MTGDTLSEVARANTARALLDSAKDQPLNDLTLDELGQLHRALKGALADVKAALEPAILKASRGGMTYVELLHVSGYGSMATIANIMKADPAPRGPRPFRDAS